MSLLEYPVPGAWIREFPVVVPLDWSDPDQGTIELFVRELADPDFRHRDLPLLTFLQGGPGGANPRPTDVSGWLAEALPHYRVVLVDQRGTGRSSPVDGAVISALPDARTAARYLLNFRADSIVRDLEHVRRTCMLAQLRRRRRLLQHRAIGTQIPAQYDRAAFRK